MKSLSRVSRTKKIALAVISLAFLCGIALFISEKTHTTNLIRLPNGNTPPQTSGPTKEQRAAQAKTDAENKQQYLDSVSKEQAQGGSTTNTNSASTVEFSASQSGNMVTVLTRIYSAASGTCKISVSNGTKTTEQSAPIIYQPEFSSCAGFSIPIDALGKGEWVIDLVASTDSGTTLSQTERLKVK